MGIKYSAQESQELIQAMTNNLQVANEVTDRLSSGCDHLISSLDSGELTGAAYTAGKGLFIEIIIPSIKKLQAAIDDIQLELTSYKHADAQVSGYGDLDLDQLKELKKLREEQLAIVEAQIQARENWLNQIKDLFTLNWGKAFSEKTILYNTKSQIESGIQDLDDKIEKLEFFVSQVSQYFSDSLEVLSLAIQGATQLSKVIVDSDGNYYADGLDMSWVQKMKDVKIENHELKTIDKNLYSSEVQFVNTLQNAYGFSEIESKIIYKLYDKLKNKFGVEKANLELVRLMAELSYSGSSWYYTAGLPLKNAEKHFIKAMEELGFKESEINLLKEVLVNQHRLSGLDSIKESDSVETVEGKLDKATNAIYGKSSYHDLDSRQKKELEEMLERFSGKIDYTHLNAVISTYYNESPMEDVTDVIFGILNERAGYLGDVAGANGAPPSMGNDDYKADLDAVNIYYRIKNNKNYVETVNEYYDNIDSQTISRAREFVVNVGNGSYDDGILHLQDKWLELESKIKDNPEAYEHWGNEPMYTFNRFLLSIIHDKNELIEEQ